MALRAESGGAAGLPRWLPLREASPSTLPYLGAGVVGLVLGIAAGFRPKLAVGGALGLVAAPVIFTFPVAGLAILLFLSFLDKVSAVSGVLSLTKIVGVLLVMGWLATAARAAHSQQERRSLLLDERGLTTVLLLFTSWVAISLVWAERPATGAGALGRFALNFVLFPIVFAAVRTRRHVVWLASVFVAGALAATAAGLANGSAAAAADDSRLKGGGLNPNQIGTLLVVAIVLAVAIAANRRWPKPARLLAVAAAVTAAVGLFMTLSRGALLGLAAAMLVAPFLAGRGRRAATLALVVAVVAGTVGWFAAIASQSAVERVTHPTREGGSGRQELWTVGWRMVKAHPVEGVGAGNFPVSSIHYVLRPGSTQNDRQIVDLRQVPHNIYLAVLSELGIVGLTLFGAIVVLSLASMVRAARAFTAQGDETMELMTRGLVIGLIGYLTALFFSSQLYDKQLWLLLALGPALAAIAREQSRRSSEQLLPLSPVRERVGRRVAALERG